MAHYRPGQIGQRTRLRHYVEYALMRGLIFVLALLPHSTAMWLARRLGDLAFDVLRVRRKVALANLQMAFGAGMSQSDLVRIARRAYRNFGMCFIEFALFGHETLESLGTQLTFENPDFWREAGTGGRGVICLTAHCGNWEMLGVCLALIDAPISAVVGDQKNLLVDTYLKNLRARQGMRLIPIGSALRDCLRTLRAGGRLGLVADQDGGRDGVFIEFFGRMASTAVGPARFAYRTGAAVVISLDRYVGSGQHSVVMYPPLIPDPSRSESSEILRILHEYQRTLEAFVREHPDSWFWMHRRWKTQPPAESKP